MENLGRIVIDEKPFPIAAIRLEDGSFVFDVILPMGAELDVEGMYQVFGPDGKLVYTGALARRYGRKAACAEWHLHLSMSMTDHMSEGARERMGVTS